MADVDQLMRMGLISQSALDRIAPRSALDTSGMGATVPPDTWTGRAQEAAVNPDIRATTDLAMGMVGPGSIKAAGLPAAIATEFADHTGRVMLADVRAAFPEVPPAQLHATLRQMQQDGRLNLMRVDNPVELTARDHAAAMQIGNEPRHMFRWVK